MSVSNATIAEMLRRYAAVLAIERADRFKIRAYQRAAETVESLEANLAELVAKGADLKRFPGVGTGISSVIEAIVRSGTFSRLEESVSRQQPELIELATRPALDSKRILRVYKKLDIHSLAELERALDKGTIREQFGPRMEFHIRHGLDNRPRMLLQRAMLLADKIEPYLKSLSGVSRVARTGSLRRKKDTVGDLNFLVASRNADAAFKAFSGFGGGVAAERKNPSQARFQLSAGINFSLAWTRSKDWGLALIRATGSDSHLEDLRTVASRKSLKLSPRSLTEHNISTSTEEDIYHGLGLEFVEPELREGTGEVWAAAKGSLPKLVRNEDLKGDLHMHTTASDGINTLAEMVAAAQSKGYEYIAITEHSQSLKITNGLSEKRLLNRVREIDQLNSRHTNFTVLKSAEVDILEDGRLDYSNAVLKELDLTVCSIHSRFGLSKTQQTDRILRAMDNPFFTILGHATGRLLLKREGYELDLEKILRHAKSHGCFVEINSSPDRLDLSDEHAKQAKELGIRIAINTDAHSIRELDFISLGVNQARRAWLEPNDVLNTFTLKRLRGLLSRS
jgi:DNA polymerase (family 10)